MPVGANIDLGNILTSCNYSAGSLNADLIPETDVSAYKWLGVYVQNDIYVGTLTFQGRFPGQDWIDITLYRMGNLDGGHSVSSVNNETSTLYGGPSRFPLFRCRMTAYTSGFATAIFQLRSEGYEGLSLANQAVSLISSRYAIGFATNNGTHNLDITAGTATDTIIYAGGTSMLCSVLVTTAGTHQATFYDNASAGSGTPVGIVVANAVAGTIVKCKGYCANGITLKGDSNNPRMTVFWTDIS